MVEQHEQFYLSVIFDSFMQSFIILELNFCECTAVENLLEPTYGSYRRVSYSSDVVFLRVLNTVFETIKLRSLKLRLYSSSDFNLAVIDPVRTAHMKVQRGLIFTAGLPVAILIYSSFIRPNIQHDKENTKIRKE